MGSEFDSNWIEAAGDNYRNEGRSSNYQNRKLKSGVKYPFFPKDTDDNGNAADDDAITFCTIRGGDNRRQRGSKLGSTRDGISSRKKSWKDIIHFCCPICNDPFIEVTSTNCGHKFCRDCIETSRQIKPTCPICSTFISSVHRLYSDDQLIESLMEKSCPAFRRRFEARKKERIQALIKEASSENLLKKIRRSLDNSVTYIRCRGSGSIFNEWWAYVSNSSYFDVVLGSLLAIMAILFYKYLPDFGFFKYMMAAASNYNGSIPQEWSEGAADLAGTEPEIPVGSIPETGDNFGGVINEEVTGPEGSKQFVNQIIEKILSVIPFI